MTLSQRNTFFKFGIILTTLSALVVIAISDNVIPAYPDMALQAINRPDGYAQFLTGHFLKTNFYAVHTALVAGILYSCISTILIMYYFEKTQAPEIIYIAVFVVSFSLEITRLLIPLQYLHSISPFYLLLASRILLFGRFFSIFSLCTAGVCAAGLDVQKTLTIMAVIAVATLTIAIGVSIDTQTWDTSLNPIRGYTSLFRLIEGAAFITTVISFFIAAHSKGQREYNFIGLGSLLVLCGRSLLLFSDTWISPSVGILILSFGTWLMCAYLHKIYLWR